MFNRSSEFSEYERFILQMYSTPLSERYALFESKLSIIKELSVTTYFCRALSLIPDHDILRFIEAHHANTVKHPSVYDIFRVLPDKDRLSYFKSHANKINVMELECVLKKVAHEQRSDFFEIYLTANIDRINDSGSHHCHPSITFSDLINCHMKYCAKQSSFKNSLDYMENRLGKKISPAQLHSVIEDLHQMNAPLPSKAILEEIYKNHDAGFARLVELKPKPERCQYILDNISSLSTTLILLSCLELVEEKDRLIILMQIPDLILFGDHACFKGILTLLPENDRLQLAQSRQMLENVFVKSKSDSKTIESYFDCYRYYDMVESLPADRRLAFINHQYDIFGTTETQQIKFYSVFANLLRLLKPDERLRCKILTSYIDYLCSSEATHENTSMNNRCKNSVSILAQLPSIFILPFADQCQKHFGDAKTLASFIKLLPNDQQYDFAIKYMNVIQSPSNLVDVLDSFDIGNQNSERFYQAYRLDNQCCLLPQIHSNFSNLPNKLTSSPNV